MSPVFTARRRAEEFDSLVEAASTGTVDPARYSELLEVVGALRATPPAEPRPAFVADLRERLMAAAETELAAGRAPVPPVDRRLTVPVRSPRERRLAVAVGGFALVGATTSMAVAAQSALPGDALYPLKRAIENAQAGFSVTDAQKGSTMLANASGRLMEVDELTRQGETLDVAAIEATLTAFTAQATEAAELLIAEHEANGDEAALVELERFTAESLAALDALAPVLPPAAHDSLVQAGQALAEIDLLVRQLCDSCDGALTSIPQWLLIAGRSPGEQGHAHPGTTPAAEPSGPRTRTPARVETTVRGAADAPTEAGAAAQVGGTGREPSIALPQGSSSSSSDGDGAADQEEAGGVGAVLGGLTPAGSGSTTVPERTRSSDGPAAPTVGDVVGTDLDQTTDPLQQP